MPTEITVHLRSVYGNDLVYPVCDLAKKLAVLVGRKTFNHQDMTILQEIGYKFKFVAYMGQ